MLTASVENMLVTSIDTTLETGVVPTQYIVIISTVRRQSDSVSLKLVSNIGSTWVRLLISAWVGSFQNASIEIKQFSFVYQQNRFTVIVVLMITYLILAFVKVGLVYISIIYIRYVISYHLFSFILEIIFFWYEKEFHIKTKGIF